MGRLAADTHGQAIMQLYNAAPYRPRTPMQQLTAPGMAALDRVPVIQGIQRCPWGVGPAWVLHTPSWQQEGPALRGGYLGCVHAYIHNKDE